MLLKEIQFFNTFCSVVRQAIDADQQLRNEENSTRFWSIVLLNVPKKIESELLRSMRHRASPEIKCESDCYDVPVDLL